MTDVPILLTVKQYVAKHPAFTEGGIRKLIFDAASNGFDQCLVRIGRKVLIDEGKVFCWIANQNKAQGV